MGILTVAVLVVQAIGLSSQLDSARSLINDGR